jgi:phosphoglycerate dehydrogenase-like enzyme
MNSTSPSYTLLIASYLEPEHVARIRQVDPRLRVLYEPELLATPEYPADHYGVAQRTPEQEARWRSLLTQADILFDFDYSHPHELPDLAPRLLWIQASSAGVGQFVKRHAYETRLPNTIITTASGLHARPLAEFCLMAMLMHYKKARLMLGNQQQHRWERFAADELEGRTLAVIGLGKIGCEAARLAHALGMRVIATQSTYPAPWVEQLFPPDHFRQMLPLADVLVLSTPHTPTTDHLIGAAELALLKPGVYVINIARGAVLDELALIAALRSGHLGGAALDVFAQEPLPADSPLWDMDNVLISPHSTSTSHRENALLTDLFIDNLRRFLADQPLRNVLDPEKYY